MVALTLVAIANTWVGLRLPMLLQDTQVNAIHDLERRAAAFPRERVRVLVAGNSHALAGLRPPLLAEALGLGPDEVFSFALPAGSPQETRLLLERHLASYPRVRLLLCGVEEYYLGGFHELRLRYLTTGNGLERARFAAGQPIETQLRLLVGTWLPLLDFGATLRADALNHPRHTLRLLVKDGPPTNTAVLRSASIEHRWGVPLPWEELSPLDLRRHALSQRTPEAIRKRAEHLLTDFARVPVGVTEIGRLARRLEARGARLTLVEMPYSAPLEAALGRLNPAASRSWRASLDTLPEAERPSRIQAPVLATTDFYDADHLAYAGAQALARHIAQDPTVRRVALKP